METSRNPRQMFGKEVPRSVEPRNAERRAAFEKEREAAEPIEERTDLEPTRSVLFRSAASLAMDCQDFAEAERLLEKGLSGRPPADLAEEMRNLRQSLPAKEPLGGRRASFG